MIRSIAPRWLFASLLLSLPAAAVFAETIEFVTYYPAPAGNETHMTSLTVGTDYQGENPADGEALFVGPVGIGTTTPVNALDVNGLIGAGVTGRQLQTGLMLPGGAAAVGFWANLRTAGANNLVANSLPVRGAAIVIDSFGTGGRLHIAGNRQSAAQGALFDPLALPNALMTFLLDSGDIGINTTAPVRLPGAVAGDDQINLDIRRNVTVGGTTVSNVGSINWRNYDANGPWWHQTLRNSGNLEMHLYPTGPGGASTTVLNMTPAGNVGIGTATPQFFSNAANRYLAVDAGTNNIARIGIGANVGVGAFVGALHFYNSAQGDADQGLSLIASRAQGAIDSGTFEIWTYNAGVLGQRMAILPNGNVGIGTGSPAHPLEMASGAHVTAGGVWRNASSRELKTEINPLTFKQAAETLAGLQAVTFRYKATEDERHVGFIAEEVPDLVATKDRKGLSPMDITAVLTKVVQELKAENEALKERVRRLETASAQRIRD